VFGNLDFKEQIHRLIDISSTALTDDIKNDLGNILQCEEKDYYYKD
jgi:hypothetical protein